jgi:ATP-binding cassette subfamily B (MDR/TAP) protein 1
VSAFVIAFAVQWKLTLITISIVPSIIVGIGMCITVDTKNEAQLLPIYSRASVLAEEAFNSIRTVHSFWLHPFLSRKYDDDLDKAMKIGMKKSPIYAVMFSIEFFWQVLNVRNARETYTDFVPTPLQHLFRLRSGFLAGHPNVLQRRDQGGGRRVSVLGNDAIHMLNLCRFTVILAVIVAATAMSTIAPQIIAFTKAASAATELFQTIDRKSEIDPLSDEGRVPATCEGVIEIRDITFAYPSRADITVLDGFTLSAPAHKTTALVGASGSGKSTIIGLLGMAPTSCQSILC